MNLTRLPSATTAVRTSAGGIERIEIPVKDALGNLLAEAIPVVSIVKDGSYAGLEIGDDPAIELDLIASIEHKLTMGLLAGFVVEGIVPYGRSTSNARQELMLKATFSGLPVARVGRGAPEGFADHHEFQIAASNLTGTKARFLLMACLLKFGSLPAAKNPQAPTAEELQSIRHSLAAYQEVFDTH